MNEMAQKAVFANGELEADLRKAFALLAPSDVAIAVASVGPLYELMDAERQMVSGAAKTRYLEFVAGRWCARRALVLAGGAATTAVTRGRLREPLWPAGFSGSITHGRRFAAAAAYRLPPGDQPSIGIDLIDPGGFSEFSRIAPRILSADDRSALGAQEISNFDLAKAFGAKEAAVKVLSPRAARFIDFAEISLRPASSGGGYVITHSVLPGWLRSRHSLVEGILLTVVTSRPEVL